MGFAEVLRHLPRLLKIRRELIARIAANGADVFVGIDAPDFNLPAAAKLKAAGIRTVQYVSPQVWAWRQSRVTTIRDSVDLVLCVLPFETEFYAKHGVPAKFIGHPLADDIPLEVDRAAARVRLGLPAERPLLAVLPGSRRAEVAVLSEPFLATAAWLQQRLPELEVAVALASEPIGAVFRARAASVPMPRAPYLCVGKARDVLAAADVVLTASGTATLEALLLKRRMVVAHRLAPLTYWLYRRLGGASMTHFSLPNLLAGREVVPEFVQGQVRPDVLGPVLLDHLHGGAHVPDWYAAFTAIHDQLRRGASSAAAREVLELVRRSR
jgi:lipid-A-disaccharide synthase